MLRITVLLICLSISLNGISARVLVRRSNECQSDLSGAGYICPQADGMFPNKVCQKFWHCSNCYAYEKDCPADLVWNDPKQECDYSSNVVDADCSNGDAPAPSTTQAPTTTSAQETTTERPTEGPTEGSTEGPTGGSNEGSSTGAQETTTGSDETTTQGSNDETTTEGNTETPTEDCSDATTTEASSDETTTGGQTTTTDAVTTETEQETSEASTEGSGGEGTPDPSRPNCENGQQYYPHSDCNKFWQCSNGVAYEMNCAPGTIWDQSLPNCNHPENVSPFPPNCRPNHVFRK